MIFWIYVNNTKQHLVSETDETLYIFKLFNVKIFWKKKTTKYSDRQAWWEFHNLNKLSKKYLYYKIA